MTAQELQFDADALLDGLRPWIKCESPTFDAASVDAMMDLAAADLAAAGAKIERVPGRMGFGGCVKADFPHARSGEPGILVLGHLDTVHPIGTLAALPFRRDETRAWGPGICDMKGGNYVALAAIRKLAEAAIATPLPVTVLFTSDEEIGSPSCRELIEAEASRHKYVLIPEPGGPEGEVTTARYAIARYRLEATGRPSHAGAALSAGKSAIRIMAHKIIAIEDMTTDACTFSVGIVHGGQWSNCVTTRCSAEALSMAKRQDDLDGGVQRMLAHTSLVDGIGFEVSRGVCRPVWERDPAFARLYDTAKTIAAAAGYDIGQRSSGGGSDGNFTGAMGIPTLDGLGVSGGGIHTLDEHIVIETLAKRAHLIANLLAALH